MSFRPNQKLVFMPVHTLSDTGMIIPNVGEIVTLLRPCNHYEKSWDIKEYPSGEFGMAQSFHEMHLRPLVDKYPSAISELISKEITIERSDAQPKEVEVQQ